MRPVQARLIRRQRHMRTDSQGYPVNGNGNVSTNPEDYRALVCGSQLGKDAPDYQQECVDQGNGH